MDKEDNLFEDQIDEDDDLLNISLDDLSTDEIVEPLKEEPDEDIIELIDLLEKGEAAFLGVSDDSDGSSEEDLSSEAINEIPDEDADATPQSEMELDDDLWIDTDMSAQDDDLESDLSDEEFDKLLTEDSMDDLGIESEESEDTVSELENFLNEVEMENPTDDSVSSFDNTEDLSPEMENFSGLNDVLDEAGLWDDEKTDISIGGDGDGTLFEDIDLTDCEKEEIPDTDDLIAELDDVVEKTIASPEDSGSSEEPIWEMGRQSDTDDNVLESEAVEEQAAIDENDIETAEGFFDEVDDIPLVDEDAPLEELFPEDILQDGVIDEEPEGEGALEQTAVGKDYSEVSEDILDEADGISPEDEDESLEELFSEEGLQDEAVDEEPEDSPDQTAVDVNYPEVSDGLLDEIDDIPLDGETLEELLSEDELGDEGFTDGSESESEQELFSTDGEQVEVTDESTDAIMDDSFKDIETEESLLTEEVPISAPDTPETEMEISETVTQLPIISEEKVEKMVRVVVGEVVERIAREVFSEIAEKVITEAIDSLKKSLDSDSE